MPLPWGIFPERLQESRIQHVQSGAVFLPDQMDPGHSRNIPTLTEQTTAKSWRVPSSSAVGLVDSALSASPTSAGHVCPSSVSSLPRPALPLFVPSASPAACSYACHRSPLQHPSDSALPCLSPLEGNPTSPRASGPAPHPLLPPHSPSTSSTGTDFPLAAPGSVQECMLIPCLGVLSPFCHQQLQVTQLRCHVLGSTTQNLLHLHCNGSAIIAWTVLEPQGGMARMS